MLGNLTPSTGISVFVHMCHVADRPWCTGALSDLPDVWKGTKSGVDFEGRGASQHLAEGVVINPGEVSVQFVTSQQGDLWNCMF